jgi:hypothetical protein
MPKMSRVVDFSRNSDNNFVYNILGIETSGVNNYILAGQRPNGAIQLMGIRWNSSINRWEFYPNSSDGTQSESDHFFMMSYSGDFFMISDPTVPTASQSCHDIWVNLGSGVTHSYSYFESGTIRNFWPFATHRRTTISELAFTFGTYCSVVPLVMAGITMPINAVLFHGASGSTKHHYEWQSSKTTTGETPDDGGALLTDGGMVRDATAACCAVTTDACAKLKTDNPNLRIYVVKYRKQSQYRHKTSGTAQAARNFDYGYIDSCATGDDYVYDVDANHYKKGTDANATADETAATADANLAKALADIAADIKSWSGYQEAKNVL